MNLTTSVIGDNTTLKIRSLNWALRNVVMIVRNYERKLAVRPGKASIIKSATLLQRKVMVCTNQQPPQRGGAVPGPVWVGSKWLLAFPRVPVTPGTPHSFFRYAAP